MKIKFGRWLIAFVATVLTTAAFAQSAFAGAVISNGVVRLGINDRGELNFGGQGVNYVPTGFDGTRAGCPCEGWGAGAGGPTLFQGRANQAQGASNVSLVSFVSTPSTATSIVNVLRAAVPALRVTHEYIPSPQSPNLYQIKVSLENLTADTLTNVRYERLMDWDVEPTAFSEFVTINRGSTPPTDLFYSDDNGFADNLPFTMDGPLDPSTVNTNYTDKGPADHGARFTFDFGSLAPGAKKEFFLFYGASGTEVEANTAVSAAALEIFSYGQSNTAGGPTLGTPTTFIWGFRAVGGAPIIPPTLTLTPETATNSVGTSHTLTAEVKTAGGDPVPGASVVFVVTGTHPQSATRVTDAEGKATFTYTGTVAGDDDITACIDTNANNACDPGEVSDTAEKTWVAGDTTKPSCVLTFKSSTGIQVTVRDTGSGLAEILVTKSVNANTVVPPFTVGTTDAVVVTATKINLALSAQVELRVTDVAGNVTVCDPILTTFVRQTGSPSVDTFEGVPQAESKITILNGNPGVQRIDITVNGKTWKLTGLKDGQEVSLDVSSAMVAGDNNTITIKAWGAPQSFAAIVIADG